MNLFAVPPMFCRGLCLRRYAISELALIVELEVLWLTDVESNPGHRTGKTKRFELLLFANYITSARLSLSTNDLYAISPSNDTLCLAYVGGDVAGNPVTEIACDPANNSSQQWGLEQNPDGSFYIKAKDGLGCMTTDGLSVDGGVGLVTSACNGSVSQRFLLANFVAVPPLPTPTLPAVAGPLTGATAGTWLEQSIGAQSR